MKTLKQWFKALLPVFSQGKKLDPIDEASDESFPASDPPAWAGWEKTVTPTQKSNTKKSYRYFERRASNPHASHLSHS